MQIEQRSKTKINRRDKKRKPKMKVHGKSVFKIKKLINKKHEDKRISKND